MTEHRIRPALASDVARMAQIVTGWEAATGWMPHRYSVDQIARLITKAFPSREIWVAGDPVAGYLSFDPETSRIDGLYCATTGKGLGKALLDMVKDGRHFIWLRTHVPNTAAHRFTGVKASSRGPATRLNRRM